MIKVKGTLILLLSIVLALAFVFGLSGEEHSDDEYRKQFQITFDRTIIRKIVKALFGKYPTFVRSMLSVISEKTVKSLKDMIERPTIEGNYLLMIVLIPRTKVCMRFPIMN